MARAFFPSIPSTFSSAHGQCCLPRPSAVLTATLQRTFVLGGLPGLGLQLQTVREALPGQGQLLLANRWGERQGGPESPLADPVHPGSDFRDWHPELSSLPSWVPPVVSCSPPSRARNSPATPPPPIPSQCCSAGQVRAGVENTCVGCPLPILFVV